MAGVYFGEEVCYNLKDWYINYQSGLFSKINLG